MAWLTKLRRAIPIIVAGALIYSCGSDAPITTSTPTDPGTTSLDIGPAGGSLTSDDGSLTLTVPAGALGATETITIGAITPDELGAEFGDLVSAGAVGAVYELGPDGLQFDDAVTVRFQSAQVPLHRNDSLLVVAEFLLTAANGAVEAPQNLGTLVDLEVGTVTVEGQLLHFSPLVALQSNNGVSFFVNGVPEEQDVGATFAANARIFESATGPLGGIVTVLGSATYEDRSSSPVVPQFDPLLAELSGDPEAGFTGTFSYICEAPGTGVYASDLAVRVRFDLSSGPVEATSFANYITDVRCVEAPPDLVELAVTIGGDGSGTVTSSPEGIDCPLACVSAFPQGSEVTLTAVADENAVFEGWTNEAPDACGSNQDCVIAELNENNDDITAVFSQEPQGDVYQVGDSPERVTIGPANWEGLALGTGGDHGIVFLVPVAEGIAIFDPIEERVVSLIPYDALGGAAAFGTASAARQGAAFGVTLLAPIPDLNNILSHFVAVWGAGGWYLQELIEDQDGNIAGGVARPPGGGNPGMTTAVTPSGNEGATADMAAGFGMFGAAASPGGGAPRVIITEAENTRIVAQYADPLTSGSYDGQGVMLLEGAARFPGLNSAILSTYEQSPGTNGQFRKLIVITQGAAESGFPSQLYLSGYIAVFRQYGTAQLVEDDIGSGARSLRCVENPEPQTDEAEVLCFAFMFESDWLAPILVFSDFSVVVPDPIEVSAGPVTGDVRLMPDGNVEVISTGFDDGGVSVAQMDWEGNVLFTASGTVPAGCVQPGSIRYWPTDPNLAYASCYGSGAIARVDLGAIR